MAEQAVPWNRDVEEAVNQAGQQRRFLLAYFSKPG
jgi:hypothetical protein